MGTLADDLELAFASHPSSEEEAKTLIGAALDAYFSGIVIGSVIGTPVATSFEALNGMSINNAFAGKLQDAVSAAQGVLITAATTATHTTVPGELPEFDFSSTAQTPAEVAADIESKIKAWVDSSTWATAQPVADGDWENPTNDI